MKDLTLSPETATRLAEAEDSSLYDYAHALFSLRKYAGLPVKTHALRGRLYLSSSGWLMLQIPNAIGQGAFDALHEPGAELPLNDSGRYVAHCSVMRPEEIEQIGGADKITERGHSVAYSLGPVKTVEPDGWKDVSRVWYLQILSPEIQAIRRSYGLTSLPNDDKYDLHLTFGVKKRNVLYDRPITKLSDEKDAAHPYSSRFTGDPNGIELPVPVAVLGGSTLAGSLLASDTGSPAADITRGAMKGLGTGGGALGGFMLANHLLPEEGPLGQSVGAGLGGLAGWLAANKLSKLLNLERKGGVGPLARQEDSEAKGVVGDLAGKKQASLSELLATHKQAETLVHYSSQPREELRPLTYDELSTDRAQGRWANEPEQVQSYVKDRKVLENYLRRRLAQRGITHPSDSSFLYASLAGRERFGQPHQYRHEAPLTDDVTNQSFFDVVGDGKSRIGFGVRGLMQAIKRWEAAAQSGGLAESEYMGMPIRPRIEIMTPATIKPNQVVAPKQAASDSLASLLQAKRESDRKNYPAKHHILRSLLQQARDEFAVGEAVDGISSVVHKPTNFQMHAPEKVMGVVR